MDDSKQGFSTRTLRFLDAVRNALEQHDTGRARSSVNVSCVLGSSSDTEDVVHQNPGNQEPYPDFRTGSDATSLTRDSFGVGPSHPRAKITEGSPLRRDRPHLPQVSLKQSPGLSRTRVGVPPMNNHSNLGRAAIPAELRQDERGHSRDGTIIIIDSDDEDEIVPISRLPEGKREREGAPSKPLQRDCVHNLSRCGENDNDMMHNPVSRQSREQAKNLQQEGRRRKDTGGSNANTCTNQKDVGQLSSIKQRIEDQVRAALEAGESKPHTGPVCEALEGGESERFPHLIHTALETSENLVRNAVLPAHETGEEHRQSARERIDPETERGSPLHKRKRAKVKEQRGAVFRPVPSKQVLTRMSRANTSQGRLCLVDRTEEDGKATFHIMGTNGNAYKCIVDLAPSCNCQDFKKRQGSGSEGPCKHLIFIFLRVFKMSKEDPRWWQKRWLRSELQRLLEEQPKGPIDSGLLADEEVRRRFRETQSQEDELEGDLSGECPICYEEFCAESGSPEDATTRCKTCKGGFHEVCIGKWRDHGKSSCPLCRASLPESGAAVMNFAQYSSIHARPMSIEEMYASSHMYIGRGGRRGIRRGGGRGRR